VDSARGGRGRASSIIDIIASPRHTVHIEERQLLLLWKLLLVFYILELLFNRLLFRVLIFIPPGRVLDVLSFLTSQLGLFSLNATVVLPALILLLHARTPLSLAVLALALLDAVGVASVSWALIGVSLLPLYLSRKRLLEALLLVFLALTSLSPSPEVVVASNILWLVAPIPLVLGARPLRALALASPFILLSLALALRSYYITGQVLSLGMGIVDPYLLPLAIALYSMSGRPGPLSLLITGPTIQLSNQVLALAAAYIVDQQSGRGALK